MFNRIMYVFITYLVNKFNYQVTNTVTVTETVVNTEVNYVDTPVVRLEYENYHHLERQCGTCLVVSTTSEIEAGFKLGVAHVLEKLRAGYVVDRR